MNDDHLPDDLNDESSDDLNISDLLASGAMSSGSAASRAQVRAKTTALVGRRRRWRQSSLVLLVAAAYGAGWLTQSWLRSPQNAASTQIADVPQSAAPTEREDAEREDVEREGADTPSQAEAVVELSELIALQRNLETSVSPYERWRNAGNRQLSGRGDIEAALRLYRKALNAATPAELQAADSSDSWLFSELKYDRQQNLKELPRANPSL